MILSMTGFGRGTATAEGKIIILEMKALNSKQLDVIVKLPSRYRSQEGWIRNSLAESAARGKIEVIGTVESSSQDTSSPLNLELIRKYKKDIERMDDMLGLPHPADWHSVLLRLPDVMKGDDHELSENEISAFKKAFTDALDSMTKFRREEGDKLYSFFKDKITNISFLLESVAPHEENRVAKIKARIYEELEKLSDVEVDNGRLEQELIYYIEKLDISEEKQRLKTHLDYFVKTMDEEGGDSGKGKKLGFIAQEMGREINTLGSKSNNAEMQIIVVKMKDELEQIKEQVLNVL